MTFTLWISLATTLPHISLLSVRKIHVEVVSVGSTMYALSIYWMRPWEKDNARDSKVGPGSTFINSAFQQFGTNATTMNKHFQFKRFSADILKTPKRVQEFIEVAVYNVGEASVSAFVYKYIVCAAEENYSGAVLLVSFFSKLKSNQVQSSCFSCWIRVRQVRFAHLQRVLRPTYLLLTQM